MQIEEEIYALLSELEPSTLSKSEVDLWRSLVPSMTEEEKEMLLKNLKEQKAA